MPGTKCSNLQIPFPSFVFIGGHKGVNGVMDRLRGVEVAIITDLNYLGYKKSWFGLVTFV